MSEEESRPLSPTTHILGQDVPGLNSVEESFQSISRFPLLMANSNICLVHS